MKFVKLSALALVMGLFVTSCGNGSGSTASSDSASATSTSASTTTTTPAPAPAATPDTTAKPADTSAMAPATK